jgi:hypothetical protein
MNEINTEKSAQTTITLTREELYERVWTIPIVKLSRTLGLSDCGFTKLCRRNLIPTPGLGYWQKLAIGKAPARPKLPPVTDSKAFTFKLCTEEAKPKEAYPKIEVPDALCSPHPIIERTLTERKLKPAKDFFSHDESVLHISVTKDSLARTLRIVDTVFKELEKRGATILVRKRYELVAKFGPEEIPFHIREKTNLVLIEGSEAEKKTFLYQPRKEYEPTGRLSLVIDAWADSMRTHFQDGARQRVEDTVGEFIGTIMLILELHKKRRENWRLGEIESQKRKERLRHENAKVEFLSGQLRLLERTELIGKYLEYLGKGSESADKDAWKAWVTDYLERAKDAVRRSPKDEELSRLEWGQPTWE